MIKLYNTDFDSKIKTIMEIYSDRKIIIVSEPEFESTFSDTQLLQYYDKLASVCSSFSSVLIQYAENMYQYALRIQKAPERVVSWVFNNNISKQHKDIAFFGVKPDFSQVKQSYKNPKDKRLKNNLGAKIYDWWEINQVSSKSKEYCEGARQVPFAVVTNIVGVLPKYALIIDPFMGVGTTALACKELGLDFIGFESNKDLYNVAKKRVDEYKVSIKKEILFN